MLHLRVVSPADLTVRVLVAAVEVLLVTQRRGRIGGTDRRLSEG